MWICDDLVSCDCVVHQLERAQTRITMLESENSELRTQRNLAIEGHADAESRAFTTTQMDTLNDAYDLLGQLVDKDTDIATLKKELASANAAIERAKSFMAFDKVELDQTRKVLAEVRKELARLTSITKQTPSEAAMLSYENRITALEHDRTVLQNLLVARTDEVGRLSVELTKSGKNCLDLTRDLAHAKSLSEHLARDNEAYLKIIKQTPTYEITARVAVLTDLLRNRDDYIAGANEGLAKAGKRIEELEKMLREAEGSEQSVRASMESLEYEVAIKLREQVATLQTENKALKEANEKNRE